MRSVRLWFLASVVLTVLFQSAFAGDRGSTFIYIRGASEDVLMSGDLSDLERVRKALKPNERALWTRAANGKEYLIRDAATLDELEKAWGPAQVIGAQMSKLGDPMSKLGEQMGKVGEQQGKLGLRQGELSVKLTRIDSDDTARRAPIERELREIEAKMAELQKQMRALEKPMKELEKQMKAIQPKHEAAVKQAQTATDALIARAINSGLAKPF